MTKFRPIFSTRNKKNILLLSQTIIKSHEKKIHIRKCPAISLLPFLTIPSRPDCRPPEHYTVSGGRHGMAGHFCSFLQRFGHASEPKIPHAQHGTAGRSRGQIHPSLCLPDIHPHPLQPDVGHECSQAQSHKLDTGLRQTDRRRKRGHSPAGMELQRHTA